jgi:3-methyladenine DNA glycosylase AlkD
MPASSEVQAAVDWLKRHGTKATLQKMAGYAIPPERAFGVPMRDIQALAKRLGHNHELALGLWATGCYEARILAAYVDEAARVTPAQMQAWTHDFDNWGICDTVCFVLFDRTRHAWKFARQWAKHKDEFVKRAAFALVWSLTVHDKNAADALFIEALDWIERAATDDRHFVKKAVNMALRAIGKRNAALNSAAAATAKKLAVMNERSAQWVGKDALREITSSKVLHRVAAAG